MNVWAVEYLGGRKLGFVYRCQCGMEGVLAEMENHLTVDHRLGEEDMDASIRRAINEADRTVKEEVESRLDKTGADLDKDQVLQTMGRRMAYIGAVQRVLAVCLPTDRLWLLRLASEQYSTVGLGRFAYEVGATAEELDALLLDRTEGLLEEGMI